MPEMWQAAIPQGRDVHRPTMSVSGREAMSDEAQSADVMAAVESWVRWGISPSPTIDHRARVERALDKREKRLRHMAEWWEAAWKATSARVLELEAELTQLQRGARMCRKDRQE